MEIPRIGAKRIEFNTLDVGFTLETSEETKEELRQIHLEQRRAIRDARNYWFD